MFKKQKLLILGDSFAANDVYPGGSSWTKLLELNDKFQVTNLAEGGSSLWFSFKNFLKQQKKHDKIIFVVTSPYRLYFPISKGLMHHNMGNLDHLLKIKKTSKNTFFIEKINAVLLYYKHIIDIEERNIYQRLVIKEIRDIRPDTILIPAFPNSIFDHQGDCLADIANKEIENLGLSLENVYKKYTDLRPCHMIDSNNQLMYDHVLNWLNGNPVRIDKKEFSVMQEKEKKIYLEKFKE